MKESRKRSATLPDMPAATAPDIEKLRIATMAVHAQQPESWPPRQTFNLLSNSLQQAAFMTVSKIEQYGIMKQHLHLARERVSDRVKRAFKIKS
ncbi:hypothetical protein J2T09_002602 [Neorhizobium huautlense]|uniref:Uncharacterized protein n=1 Tax=Neorhizobium huautlense TaxID=67774 RepID=A0ABT9PUJ0_9HYPH|nr:hypothetical protein [Neorhizobium huautlense]MDP9837845.1 hypothetical protein [Neorhizobium huautlense]